MKEEKRKGRKEEEINILGNKIEDRRKKKRKKEKTKKKREEEL